MRPRRRGFTLVEALVALVILAIVAVLAYRGTAALTGGEAQLAAESARWRTLDARVHAPRGRPAPGGAAAGAPRRRARSRVVGAAADAAGNTALVFSRAGPEFALEPGARRPAHRLSRARRHARGAVLAAARQRRRPRARRVPLVDRRRVAFACGYSPTTALDASAGRCAREDRLPRARARRARPRRRLAHRRAGSRCDECRSRARARAAPRSILAMLVAALAATVAMAIAAGQQRWFADVAARRDQVQAQSLALAGVQWTRQILVDDARARRHRLPRRAVGVPAAADAARERHDRRAHRRRAGPAQCQQPRARDARGSSRRRARLRALFARAGASRPPRSTRSPTGSTPTARRAPRRRRGRVVRAAGLAYLPANAPLVRVGELAAVRGFDEATLRARAAVRRRAAGRDEAQRQHGARPPVLAAAVAGLSDAAADALVAERVHAAVHDHRRFPQPPAGRRDASATRTATPSEQLVPGHRAGAPGRRGGAGARAAPPRGGRAGPTSSGRRSSSGRYTRAHASLADRPLAPMTTLRVLLRDAPRADRADPWALFDDAGRASCDEGTDRPRRGRRRDRAKPSSPPSARASSCSRCRRCRRRACRRRSRYALEDQLAGGDDPPRVARGTAARRRSRRRGRSRRARRSTRCCSDPHVVAHRARGGARAGDRRRGRWYASGAGGGFVRTPAGSFAGDAVGAMRCPPELAVALAQARRAPRLAGRGARRVRLRRGASSRASRAKRACPSRRAPPGGGPTRARRSPTLPDWRADARRRRARTTAHARTRLSPRRSRWQRPALALHVGATLVAMGGAAHRRVAHRSRDRRARARRPACADTSSTSAAVGRPRAPPRRRAPPRGLAAPGDALPLLGQAAPALAELPRGALKSATYTDGAWTLELAQGGRRRARGASIARSRARGVAVLQAPTAAGVRMRLVAPP